MSAVLELERVSKEYPGSPPVRALDQVSVAVAAGELAAVVGPSGSGKSTLLHLMGTLDRPGSGVVRVTGLDVAPDDRPGGVRTAGDPDRVRVPAVFPGRAPERAGQRGRRAAARGRGPRPAPPAGRRRAGAGRPGAPGRRAADPAVGRRTAAGGHRQGDRRPPAGGTGRRADRQPGLRHRRRAAGAAGRAQCGGHHDHCDHPRPHGRRLDAAPHRDAGRPHHHRHKTITTAASGSAAPAPARLRPGDLAGLASIGLRTRKLRAALSALGIAIGVAAIVAVLGLASSSQAGLLAEIAQLGTNLLTITNGTSITGQPAELPDAAPGMVGQLPGVTAVQYTGTVSADVYRSPLIPAADSDGLSVEASSLGLPAAAGTSVAQGSYLNAATAREPAAVLGAEAAQLMGVDRIWPGERIWVGGQWFYLVGILDPATLAPQIDTSILVGFPAAQTYLGFNGHPSELYVRTVNTQDATTRVDDLLAAQADPQYPNEVNVSQPSQALTAQADAAGAFGTLFLGLGAVALLVGAVGVANIMIISVLERRQEIGLRRALGATKGQIRTQFLAEAILLALAGGAAGDIAGVAATAIYAHAKRWAIVIPPDAWAGGLGAALLIGALAGLLPAIRAARLSPTQALWTI